MSEKRAVELQQKAMTLKEKINMSKEGINELKYKREQYITLLNAVSKGLEEIIEQISHNDLHIEFCETRLRKIEEEIQNLKEIEEEIQKEYEEE